MKDEEGAAGVVVRVAVVSRSSVVVGEHWAIQCVYGRSNCERRMRGAPVYRYTSTLVHRYIAAHTNGDTVAFGLITIIASILCYLHCLTSNHSFHVLLP